MMRALVIYESMFGNTRRIADAIAAGLQPAYDVEVRSAGMVRPADLPAFDLLVVGGPTHTWGMSRPNTRAAASKQAAVPGSGLQLESGASGPGLRELFDGVTGLRTAATAFDTRIDMSPMLTGRASRRIAKMLHQSGCAIVAPPQSFLVSKRPTALLPGEDARARAWGFTLSSLNRASTDRGPR